MSGTCLPAAWHAGSGPSPWHALRSLQLISLKPSSCTTALLLDLPTSRFPPYTSLIPFSSPEFHLLPFIKKPPHSISKNDIGHQGNYFPQVLCEVNVKEELKIDKALKELETKTIFSTNQSIFQDLLTICLN